MIPNDFLRRILPLLIISKTCSLRAPQRRLERKKKSKTTQRGRERYTDVIVDNVLCMMSRVVFISLIKQEKH